MLERTRFFTMAMLLITLLLAATNCRPKPSPPPQSIEGPSVQPIESPSRERAEEPSIHPTEEPSVKPTEELSVEPTEEPTAPVEPYATAPLCDSHNPTIFHTLFDGARGCHYDHAHGQPQPDWVVDVFGEEVSKSLQAISYPWQTPSEQETKHAGYINQAVDLREFDCKELRYYDGVEAYAMQFHGVGISHGKLARYHSFYGAAALCTPEGGSAGQIITGGHADFGMLMSPYKKKFVSYPSLPDKSYDLGVPPYIGEHPDGGPTGGHTEVWAARDGASTEEQTVTHELMRYAFRIQNPVDFVDPETRTTGNPVFVPFGYPDSNSSAYQLYTVEVHVPDLNGDGSRVNYEGFTDFHGNIVDDCSAPGPNCVPLILRDAVPGDYHTNLTAQFKDELGIMPGDADSYYDHDIYFDGQPSGWIDLSSFGQ